MVGLLPTGPIVTHTFPVGDALEAFAVASDASISGKVFLAWARGCSDAA
ncbi:hypothetical protein [Streptomyces sp. NPDC000878]